MGIGLKVERAGRVAAGLLAAWLCGYAKNVQWSIGASSAVDRLAV